MHDENLGKKVNKEILDLSDNVGRVINKSPNNDYYLKHCNY